MANKYLYSGATGAGTGADWANAYTTLAAAITGSAASDDIWVASDHSESTATGVTFTFPGGASTPNRFISVNRAGSVPPAAADLLAGATIATTGASNIIFAGNVYVYGVTVSGGDAANASIITLANAAAYQRWENCSFVLNNTATTSRLTVSGAPGFTELVDCTLTLGNASQGLSSSGSFLWRGGATTLIQGATLPTTLFPSGTSNVYVQTFSGVDLSNLSAKTLATTGNGPLIRLKNCKLPASFTIISSVNANNYGIEVIGCGSAGNVARNELYRANGILTTETTIKRTAGATDGTTSYSWKLVTGSNPKRHQPAETFEGAIWNSVTGSSKTLTIHCVTDNVTLQDSDIWLEVEYLGSSGTPVSTMVSSAPATQLTAGTNLTSDSGEAWTTTGLTTPVKQKMSVSFTPQMAGPIRWKVKMGKSSSTVYICPKPDLS